MKQTFQSIQSKIAKLQAQAQRMRADEISGVVARIKEAIDVYGLTENDLFGRTAARPAGASSKVSRAAKYSYGAGNHWGGRGPRPAWLRKALEQGKSLTDFAS